MNRVLAIVAALSVPTIAAVTASPLSTGARAASVPSWVPAGAKIYCDFSDDKCWDGYTSSVVAPTSLLQLVRQQGATSVGEIYTDASRTPAMISSGNLAIGSAGLQIMAQTNYLSNSTITIGTTLSPAGWGPYKMGGLPRPTVTATTIAGGPGGIAWDSIIHFPAAISAKQASQIDAGFSSAPGTQYTCSVWMKGNEGREQIILDLQDRGVSHTYLSAKQINLTMRWERYSTTAKAISPRTTFSIGVLTNGTGLSNGSAAQMPLARGGDVHMSAPQCNPGPSSTAYVATEGTPVTTPINDDITARGDLARALASYGATVVISTNGSAESQAATFIGNRGATFFGKDSTDHLTSGSTTTAATGMWPGSEKSSFSWSPSGGALSLNGSLSPTDSTPRSLSSGDIYIGSTNGARGLLNGDLVSLAVYDSKQTLIATSSQPITGITFGGLVDYNGNYYSGAKYGYTANALSYYNSQHYPRSYINGDTFAVTWGRDGNDYMTAGDTTQFLGPASGGPAGVGNNTALMYLPEWGSGSWFKVIGTNVKDFSANLGTFAQLSTCSPAAGAIQHCEWKPASLLSISCSVISGCTGVADVMLLALSRQHEYYGTYGSVYTTFLYSTWTGQGWGPWGGFPATQNGDVTTPPFFFSADYSQLVFVQYGKNYENAPGNPDDQNDYVYAVLFQWNAGIPTAPICIRMGLSNLAIPSNVDAVDGSGYPVYWQYYEGNGAWSSTSSDWAHVDMRGANVLSTAPTNGYFFGVQYLQASNRYMMTAFGSAGGPAFYDSPHPWGPYTLIQDISAPAPGFTFPTIIPSSLAQSNGRRGVMDLGSGPADQSQRNGLYTLILAPITIHN